MYGDEAWIITQPRHVSFFSFSSYTGWLCRLMKPQYGLVRINRVKSNLVYGTTRFMQVYLCLHLESRIS